MNGHGKFEFKIHFGGITVASVNGSYTIHVNPTSQPLTLTPSAGALPDETVGEAATGSASITGGKPPYSVVATGLPPGVSASIGTDGASVVLSGSPTLPGDATVSMVVTDSGA